MTVTKKNKPRIPNRRTKQPAQDRFPTLDHFVLDGSLPRVHVKVFPSRKKSRNKPNDQIVLELQCEV